MSERNIDKLEKKLFTRIKLFENNRKYSKKINVIKNKTYTKQKKSNFIITEIHPDGILLDISGGTYSFANNITWIANEKIAIVIIADNITLDFNNFSLTCINPNNIETEGINAVFSNNLTIKN